MRVRLVAFASKVALAKALSHHMALKVISCNSDIGDLAAEGSPEII